MHRVHSVTWDMVGGYYVDAEIRMGRANGSTRTYKHLTRASLVRFARWYESQLDGFPYVKYIGTW